MKTRSRPPTDLRKPPPKANKKEAPIVEEFGHFTFEGVPDELQNPSRDKHHGWDSPDPRKQQSSKE